jgi:dTDP-4-dehydrorhamnose reductase
MTMKVLVTGIKGTVAPAVAAELRANGHEVVAWDRATMPNGTRDDVRRIFDTVTPDAVMHFAMGATDWAEWLAAECRDRGWRHLHTSSVSVYGGNQFGPFAVDDTPEPDDDYGRYKLEGEQRVRESNPDSAIYRIGWQIGDAPGSNNMVDFFDREVREHGVLRASTRWYPGASRLVDTAECLVRHFAAGDRGLYHVDGNPGLNLYEIALLTRARLGADWEVEPVEGFERNHRMIDPRIQVRSLDAPCDPAPIPV